MKPRTDKPNVIVFFTDQQRWDTSGLHGNPLGLMPTFDRVAQQGTHFANTITCQPVCAPARSSLQTGIYATETGVFRNGLPLRVDDVTLAKLFNDAGYKTGYIGKWHLGGVNPGFYGGQDPVLEPRRGGYQYWLGSDLLEFVSDAYNTVLFDNDNNPVQLPGYRVDALTDAAIRYIDTHKEEPFFLFLSHLEPHFQNHRDDYPAPDGYAEAYTGRWTPPDLATFVGNAYGQLGGYYGMVRRLDEAFGRVMDALKSLGLLENTIVLFTSDHGCHFRTRNQELEEGCHDDYKRSCHESAVHVPAAAIGPGFTGGGRIESLVSLLDFTPTLLEAAGITPPEHMQGKSLMPILRRETDSVQDDVFIQISESQVGRAVRTKRWKYSVRAEGLPGSEAPQADTYTEEFLYDLKADPYELHNLIHYESHAKVAARMKERLLHRMEAAGETRPRIKDAERYPDPGQLFVPEAEIEE
jgi:arylsulfatase A-like enzyme